MFLSSKLKIFEILKILIGIKLFKNVLFNCHRVFKIYNKKKY